MSQAQAPVAPQSKAALRAACKAAGITGYGKLNNAAMVAALAAAQQPVAPQVTPANVVVVTAQEVVPAVYAGTKAVWPGVKIEKDREQRNGIKRPSVGGATRQVWNTCDKMRELLNGEIPKRGDVIRACDLQDPPINKHTASTQYALWVKFVA